MPSSKAGPLRLRPILMTTVAIMMSAVPAMLGLGPGTEMRSPMAAVALGGLTVSTRLSLPVVPVFYVVSDRAKTRLGRRKQARAAEDAGLPPDASAGRTLAARPLPSRTPAGAAGRGQYRNGTKR